MSETVLTRDQIPEEAKWDLNTIYPDLASWEEEFSQVRTLAEGYASFRGRLAAPNALLEFFKLDELVSRKADKLGTYASLRADEDTGNGEFLALRGRIFSCLSQLSAEASFFAPEILSLPESTLWSALEQNPELEVYRFELEQILREKPHILSPAEEQLLASITDNFMAPGEVYSMLTNADLALPDIEGEDGPAPLTLSNYFAYLTSPVRSVRRAAYTAVHETFGGLVNTFAGLLNSAVKNTVLVSEVRGYPSSLEGALSPNCIPTEVYTGSIETVRKNLGLLQQYVSLKKKLLGLDTMQMYDLYVPVVKAPEDRVPFDRAVSIIREGLAPLGEEYLRVFETGIRSRWVDRYPSQGKRSGAYSGGSYDTMPFIMMNYNDQLADMLTLAHEAGHSLHSYFSNRAQPFIYARYSIFCAEVASTTNEILLIRHLIETEQDPAKKVSLINMQLEQVRTTVFRQLMMAEFELMIHRQVEQGEPLTADLLCESWESLNRQYYGDELTDDLIGVEWARIPHFYQEFYVYQYATGYAAANCFARRLLKKEPGAVEQYQKFLSGGASAHPIELLQQCGVDMLSEEPLQDVMDSFRELLGLLEEGSAQL